MKHGYILMTLLASGLVPTTASAAEAADSENDLPSGGLRFERTTPEVAEILEKTRPSEPQSIPTPKFVVRTADNKFLLTIGGKINPIIGGDIGNNLYHQDGAGIDFVTSQIPVPAVAGKKGDFFINPISGNVDMQIVGLAGTPNQITGYIKVGTNGSTHAIVLKRAYVTWHNFTGGMKLTLFQDQDACQPPTIDPEGPCGEVSTVSYELSYTSPSYNGFRYAIGIDIPSFYSSNGVYRGKDYPTFEGVQVDRPTDAEQIVPDIPAWVEYSFSPNNRIRLSGLLRNFAYRDLLEDKTRNSVGWGAMLSGNLSPDSKWIFYYQVAYGKGIGAYIQDIAGHPISYTPENSHPGKMTPSPMLGANVGLTYQPNSKWQFNAMFSESRLWDVETYSNVLDEAENYKYALYGAINGFYNINSWLQAGLEYVWGRRVTWNIGGANDSRVQAQLAFTF